VVEMEGAFEGGASVEVGTDDVDEEAPEAEEAPGPPFIVTWGPGPPGRVTPPCADNEEEEEEVVGGGAGRFITVV